MYLQFWRQVAPVDENPWLLELVQQHEFRSARGGDGIETVRQPAAPPATMHDWRGGNDFG